MNAPARQLAPGRYRLTGADYVMLAEGGAFGDARTELIEGEIVVLSAQFRPHGMVKLGLYDALRDRLRADRSPFRPVVEFSLILSPHSMPEPDVMLTSEPSGAGAVPLASVPLVIGVSDTTLEYDLGAKQRLYASAGVPEYWVADVNGRVIHRMWSPVGGAYAERDEATLGEQVAAATLDGVTISTDGF